jgi:CheY-like chemotaxis protein
MKILIAEPVTTRQRQLRTVLSALGHRSSDIEVVTDPSATLTAAKQRHFDCVFVSHTERFDGVALVQEVRRDSHLQSLPVVLYSPRLTKEVILAVAGAGTRHFLAYPFTVRDVEAVIRAVTAV